MSQWHVELICERPELLAFLSMALHEPVCTVKAGSSDCYYINPGVEPRLAARKTSGYYLLSSEFDSLREDGQVCTRAIAMLPLLNALVKLKISAFAPPLEIDDVFRLDAAGRMIWVAANVTWTHSSLESKLQKVAGQPLNFTEIWHLSQKYPEVNEALHQLANETNWFNLYKVYEIIELDVGKKTLDTWTHGENDDFTYSANNAYASQYAARHSSVNYRPSHKRKSLASSEAAELMMPYRILCSAPFNG
jgi:hypothetical protein